MGRTLAAAGPRNARGCVARPPTTSRTRAPPQPAQRGGTCRVAKQCVEPCKKYRPPCGISQVAGRFWQGTRGLCYLTTSTGTVESSSTLLVTAQDQACRTRAPPPRGHHDLVDAPRPARPRRLSAKSGRPPISALNSVQRRRATSLPALSDVDANLNPPERGSCLAGSGPRLFHRHRRVGRQGQGIGSCDRPGRGRSACASPGRCA